MHLTYSHCVGLDVHKKSIVACCLVSAPSGKAYQETRTYGTNTRELLAMGDWFSQLGVTHVAMESTGEYWKPVYNLLEDRFEVLVVNAHHLKQVPGRKTDVKDAEWIAQLLSYGLLRGSLIPPLPQRDLRDLTRQRTILVQERARVINRLQKVLEWANIKLASVVSDISGVSARAMLKAMVSGQTDEAQLATLAKGRLCRKQRELEQALHGYVRDHHRFLIANHLSHIDFLDEQLQSFDKQIEQLVETQSLPCPPGSTDATVSTDGLVDLLTPSKPLSWQTAIAIADSIPGVARQSAQLLIAEIGVNIDRFPSAAHLCKWARVCPGNYESAGKRYSGNTGQANRWLRSALVQAANAAIKCKQSYLAVVYRRLAARRGHKKAILAVAHRILTALYHMLLKQQPYQDLGAGYLDQRQQQRTLHRLQHRAEQLGYQLQPKSVSTSVADG